jgi:tripartite ATP-independent transporter DctM subunit
VIEVLATPELVGVVGVLLMLLCLTLGIPIAVSLGLVGCGGLALLLGPEAALVKAGVVAFETISRYELGVLPLFLLMANLCFAAGASSDLYDAASAMIGHRRGGLALASIGGCAGFGAISGSSLATAATIGLVALPEMRKRGYSDTLATGAVAAGGTLGSMIPPSGALIVFGIIAEQSIGKLFTAAIVPVITQALAYMLVIWMLCRLRPGEGPAMPRAGWARRRATLRRVIDLTVLVLLVVGGIAVGWFTPSEAASVGACGALLICALRGRLTIAALRKALGDTLQTTGMIYAVIIGALLFSVFVNVSGLATAVSGVVAGLHGQPIAVVLVMALILLLLGCVLDGLALMLLATPIMLPIIESLGLSPIWFGVFLIRAMEIGFVTPPIGINVYVIQKISGDVPLQRVFRGVVPFIAADLVHLLLLILFPAMALALPAWLAR